MDLGGDSFCLACNRDGAQRWLAAYTRPKHEGKVELYLRQRGWQTFLPCHRSWRQWSDRRKLLSAPLFPSYVFVQIDDEERRRAIQAPGLLWFVHNRLGPVAVDEGELEAIRRLLASGLQFDPMPHLSIGDEVEITAGPMRGCRGYLVRKDTNSIALTVSAVNGCVRVTLPDPTWLARSASAPRAPVRSVAARVATAAAR